MDRQASAVLSNAKDPDLIGAVLELVSELRLSEVLRRTARTASVLVDARFGALAVLDMDDRVVELVELGTGDGAAAWLGMLLDVAPLGLLRTEPELADPSPRDHAPETPKACALGVPIRSRRGFRANIYTADKSDSQGFTDADESLLVSFAAVAGAVIDNAHLHEEAQQRELWVALQSQIATLLLGGMDSDEVLDVVARGARELTDSELSTVLVHDGFSSLTLRAADGQGVRQLVGATFPIETTISGDIIRTGEPVLLADASKVEPTSEPLLSLGGIGRAIFVPLAAGGDTIGTLAVGRRAGRTPMSQMDVWLLESFAAQVSVALEYGRARAELERLAVVEDQERIARDLHDTVIQQLFATGMSLQATAHRLTDAAASERLQQAVDMLDTVIHDIRAAVFALGSPNRRNGGMRATVRDLASQMFGTSGLTLKLHLDGPIDTIIGPDTQQHVLATLREAMSNVARHAHASRVDVFLRVGPDIVVRVVDDGVGIDARRPQGSGLANLRARAQGLGGEFEVTAPTTGGTTLEWRVPLTRGPEGAEAQ